MKMSARTLKALKGSIKKWEKIVEGTGVDKRGDNCPLCQLFKNDLGDCQEIGCIVAEKTKCDECVGTPYDIWNMHQVEVHTRMERKVHCPTCLKLAKAELRFLKGLLPKEPK